MSMPTLSRLVGLVGGLALAMGSSEVVAAGFQKIDVVPYYTYTVSVSGGVTMPDNPGGDDAEGVVLFFDDAYNTRWEVVRAGESISFRQSNWGYFYAGLLHYEASSVPTFTGEFTVTLSSNGGTQGTYTIDKSDVVIVSGPFRRIDVVPYYLYTVSVSGGVTMPDNPGGDGAEGVVLFFDDAYDTRWEVLRAGESISFRQSNWGYFYAGLIYHESSGVPSFTGEFLVDLQSSGGTNGTYQVNKDFVAIIRTDYHPADSGQDSGIKIAEMTAYGAAWKSGQTWPVPPNPIPIEYVTNAGLIWKSGETYHFDETRNPPYAPGAR